MKWLLIFAGILVCVILIVLLIGYLLPVQLFSDSEWTEVDPHDHRLPFKIVSRDPDLRPVIRMNDQYLPFGGTWEYRIGKGGDGTTVTITEDGEVYNPLFRFVSKFIMGHSATLKRYSTYLESSFK